MLPLSIRAVDVVKEWTFGKEVRVAALRGVSLEIRRGEKVALLGRSGSGKSTLLNLLGGLDRATSGLIEGEGRDLGRMSGNELAQYRLEVVGMIFQSFHLVASSPILANVEMPLIFAGVAPRDRDRAARRALEAVGLGDRIHHRPAELSGGEQQRAAIARALVNDPPLVLADEPTGNLDSENAAAIMEMLDAHVRRRGATLVLVTHDEDLARRLADRVLRMKDGLLLP
jgi:putative ABC transport system ATP-binding protein